MITLHAKNEEPIMQGNTSLADDKTILFNNSRGICVHCKCGKPFADSILEVGIILDTVTCSNCNSESAHIVDRD